MSLNYYQKFIDFFKRHGLYNQEVFDYLRKNSIQFDYRDTDYQPLIGCFYLTKGNKLTKINLIVPYINNDITVLINIHEYIHGIIAYKYINKRFSEDLNSETLPILYERIYLEENKDNQTLRKHFDSINDVINESNSTDIMKYKIALSIQEKLFDYYTSKHPNIKELSSKAKKLTKKQNCNS